MTVEKFEDLICWQKGKQISLLVYEFSKHIKDFGFSDQIRRASISISSNIAEGFERRSNKELKNFLFIAKGSCAEVRSLLWIARDLSYLDDKAFKEVYDLSIETSRLISGFIKKL